MGYSHIRHASFSIIACKEVEIFIVYILVQLPSCIRLFVYILMTMEMLCKVEPSNIWLVFMYCTTFAFSGVKCLGFCLVSMYYIFSPKFFWLFKSPVSVLNLLDSLPFWRFLFQRLNNVHHSISLAFQVDARVRGLLSLVHSICLSLANGRSFFQNSVSFSWSLPSFLKCTLIFEKGYLGDTYIFETVYFWEYLHFSFPPFLNWQFRYQILDWK